MRIKNRSTPAVLLAILLSATALAFMTNDERYVAAPALACVVMVLWLWMTLWDRDQKIPIYDVGMFCALATLVYTVYPLINYWIDGLQFGPESDFRLQSYNISPAELGFFHLRHVLYLFSFVVIYRAYRGKGTVETGNVGTPSHSVRNVIISLFLLLTGYILILQLTTGANFNTSYEPEAYNKSMAAFAGLPLLQLQISAKLAGILFLIKLALLTFVLSRYKHKKLFIILLVWIAAEIIKAFYIKGGRTELVLFLMAIAVLYHRMIKPLKIKITIALGTTLLVLFIFLGLYRSYYDFGEVKTDSSRIITGMYSGNNEFQVLLGTAYDVLQRKKNGTVLPWYLYINDIITILPAQQIMPFEKVPASEWYLREIGLSGSGLGLMWGVITQSIVGLDWLELALRGAILGYILARFHRWYLKHQCGFLETLLYMYICIKVYYTFRDTTFSPLANLVWEVIPFYILLRIWTAIRSRKLGAEPSRRIALSSHKIK